MTIRTCTELNDLQHDSRYAGDLDSLNPRYRAWRFCHTGACWSAQLPAVLLRITILSGATMSKKTDCIGKQYYVILKVPDYWDIDLPPMQKARQLCPLSPTYIVATFIDVGGLLSYLIVPPREQPENPFASITWPNIAHDGQHESLCWRRCYLGPIEAVSGQTSFLQRAPIKSKSRDCNCCTKHMEEVVTTAIPEEKW